MMTTSELRRLAWMSITDPASAARAVLEMKLERETLWLGFALAVVLNAFLHGLSNLAFGPMTMPLPGMPISVVGYGALMAGGLALTIAAVHRVGRWLGGQGSFQDVMALIVWMQLLLVAVQAVTLVLALTIPLLSALLALAANLVALYVFLHFIDQAHRLGSLMRAVGVLVLSVLAIAFALFILLSLVGGPIPGALPHV
ncbi:YIP1 family protein [Ruegeria marina]|uniref:Yip1 domain-containing protein n=1 Tax=Ruegeria marina TaxID=639004 RepID=A0A1G6Q2P1_9RHOB|nr:YIP1 family protein [Ruegeria marina]SDC86722.1 Yip1 domain-containing protein [Ruegeria marina]